MYIIFLNYVISVVKQKNLLPVTVKWSIDSVVEQNNFSYNQSQSFGLIIVHQMVCRTRCMQNTPIIIIIIILVIIIIVI